MDPRAAKQDRQFSRFRGDRPRHHQVEAVLSCINALQPREYNRLKLDKSRRLSVVMASDLVEEGEVFRFDVDAGYWLHSMGRRPLLRDFAILANGCRERLAR